MGSNRQQCTVLIDLEGEFDETLKQTFETEFGSIRKFNKVGPVYTFIVFEDSQAATECIKSLENHRIYKARQPIDKPKFKKNLERQNKIVRNKLVERKHSAEEKSSGNQKTESEKFVQHYEEENFTNNKPEWNEPIKNWSKYLKIDLIEELREKCKNIEPIQVSPVRSKYSELSNNSKSSNKLCDKVVIDNTIEKLKVDTQQEVELGNKVRHKEFNEKLEMEKKICTLERNMLYGGIKKLENINDRSKREKSINRLRGETCSDKLEKEDLIDKSCDNNIGYRIRMDTSRKQLCSVRGESNNTTEVLVNDILTREKSTERTGKDKSIDTLRKEKSIERTGRGKSIDTLRKENPIERIGRDKSIDTLRKEKPTERTGRDKSIDTLRKEKPTERTGRDKSIDTLRKEKPTERTGRGKSIDTLRKEKPIERTGRDKSIDTLRKEKPTERTGRDKSIDTLRKEKPTERTGRDKSIDILRKEKSTERTGRGKSIDTLRKEKSTERIGRDKSIGTLRKEKSVDKSIKNKCIENSIKEKSLERIKSEISVETLKNDMINRRINESVDKSMANEESEYKIIEDVGKDNIPKFYIQDDIKNIINGTSSSEVQQKHWTLCGQATQKLKQLPHSNENVGKLIYIKDYEDYKHMVREGTGIMIGVIVANLPLRFMQCDVYTLCEPYVKVLHVDLRNEMVLDQMPYAYVFVSNDDSATHLVNQLNGSWYSGKPLFAFKVSDIADPEDIVYPQPLKDL